MTHHVTVTGAATPAVPAARVAFGAALAFLALFATLHVLEPEFDPSWRFLSEYALGRVGWVMGVAFLALATSCVALVLALRAHLPTFTGKVGLGCVLLGALGFTVCALFTTDPITAGRDALTTSGQLHGWGAVLANVFALGAAGITWSLARNRTWASVRWAMLGALLLMGVSLGWFFSVMPDDFRFGPDVPIGWPGRVLHVAYGAWLMAVAWGTLRANRRMP